MIRNRSDVSSGRSTSVSGSPNLQLNSKTFGPSVVNIKPAYSTPAQRLLLTSARSHSHNLIIVVYEKI